MSDWMIQTFDYHNATEDQYRALYDFSVAMRQERLPDDPPPGLDEYVARLKNIPDVLEMSGIVARAEDGAVVGEANTFLMPGPDNPHLMQASIDVHPHHRRRGIGRRLLGWVAEEALRRDRTLTLLESHSTAPAGEAFARRIGASLGATGRTNQLVMADLDRVLVQRWLDAAPVEDFELRFVEGAYPDDLLKPMADLLNVVANDQPRENLDMQDAHFGPEILRYLENMLFSAGGKRWAAIVIDSASREFVGYSEITWNPSRGHIVQQQGTGVYPHYRGRGIGRWLKAAVLHRLITERPEVQFIRTSNVSSNAPMIHINEALGFRTYFTDQIWQVETDALLAYLG
ncbi:MAG: GNAT family protein [Caldilineaceae bacterium]